MKWAVFSLSQMPDQTRRVEAFDEDLDYFVKAEELGYDTVWLAEHLFSTYGVVTSTQVYAAAVAPAHEADQDRHGGGGDPLQPSAQDRLGLRADRHIEPRAPPVRRRAGLPAARVRRPRRADGGSARDDERGRRHRARRLDEGDGPPARRPPLARPRPCGMPAEADPEAASAGLSGVDLAGELHPGGGARLPPAAGLALHLPHLPGSVGREAPGKPRHLRGHLRGQRPRPEGGRAHDAHALFLP